MATKRRRTHCECSDPGCPVHKGSSHCPNKSTGKVYRSDMEDRSGTAMCRGCASDALDSGVFYTKNPGARRRNPPRGSGVTSYYVQGSTYTSGKTFGYLATAQEYAQSLANRERIPAIIWKSDAKGIYSKSVAHVYPKKQSNPSRAGLPPTWTKAQVRRLPGGKIQVHIPTTGRGKRNPPMWSAKELAKTVVLVRLRKVGQRGLPTGWYYTKDAWTYPLGGPFGSRKAARDAARAAGYEVINP